MKIRLSSALRRFKIAVLISPIFSLIFLLPHSLILAQDLIKRPGVGLVLSGGGAFGMAHVGVIKVMEEAGLRPDYITGVSMGSIIGGMYSIGYSADSLEKILKIANWDLILSNKIPENKIIFPEKYHFHNSVISLPVTLKRVRLPSGMINGQQIEQMLSFYSWPAADINDFSKLPIPFMCLATNLVTCNKVELKSGYLPDAMRASMAVPSIFTPLKIDSLLLIDGGMIRNFAASEVRDMGADIIIGSYTGRHLYKEDELQSVPEIMMQLGFFTGLNDFKEQRKLVDLLIEPDLSGLPRTKFEDVDSIIHRGYRAALPYKEYFRRLADSLNSIGPQKPLQNILDKEYYSFDKIEITGNKIYSNDQILGVLDINPGENVDKYLLKEKIELLYGKVWFEKVKYRFLERDDSMILVIDCTEKSRAILYGSVHYDESLKSGAIIGLSIKNLLTKRSVIDFNSFIGRFYRLRFDYLQFIDRNQKYGLSVNIYGDNTFLPLMKLEGEAGNVISRNYYHGLTLDRRLSLNHMMALSAGVNMMNLIPGSNIDDHLKKFTCNYLTAAYEYKVNTLDIKHFPNRGMVLNLYAGTSKLLSGSIRTDSSKTTFKERFGSNFSSERFYTIYGNFRHYYSSGEKVTYSVSGDALYISDTDSISAQNNFFLLGGLSSDNKRSIPMMGFHPNEIAIRKLASIGTEIDIEIIENLHLNFMASIFAAQEVSNKGLSLFSGYGIGAGYMSVIGPLRIGIMHGRYSNEEYLEQIRGYISFGYNF